MNGFCKHALYNLKRNRIFKKKEEKKTNSILSSSASLVLGLQARATTVQVFSNFNMTWNHLRTLLSLGSSSQGLLWLETLQFYTG